MKFALTDLTFDQLTVAATAINNNPDVADITAVEETPVVNAPPAAVAPAAVAPAAVAPAAVAPVAVAPVAVAPVAVAGNTAEFDDDGQPWDERIHANTKTKTQKGLWKKGKAVTDEVKAQVAAELVAQPPTVAPVTAPIQVQEAPPVSEINAQLLAGAANIGIVPAPVAVAPVAVAPVAVAPAGIRTDITHEQMMTQINVAIHNPANPVTATDLPAICKELEMEALNDCINDPVKIGTIYARCGGL